MCGWKWFKIGQKKNKTNRLISIGNLQWPVWTKQSHKTYNTNTNLKQNHKIRNINAKLYNTNRNLKENHKIRNTNTKLYNTNTKLYNTNKNLKQNHKIHNTNTKLYDTNTKLYNTNRNTNLSLCLCCLWFCFKFLFVL